MAKVEAFEIPGIKCWFWSNDHEPPHFHAKRDGAWEVRVEFLGPEDSMLSYVSWSKREMSQRDRERLCDNAVAFRHELLLQWEAIQEQNDG